MWIHRALDIKVILFMQRSITDGACLEDNSVKSRNGSPPVVSWIWNAANFFFFTGAHGGLCGHTLTHIQTDTERDKLAHTCINAHIQVCVCVYAYACVCVCRGGLGPPAGTDGPSSGGMIRGKMEVRTSKGGREGGGGRTENESWKEWSEWPDGSQGDVRRPEIRMDIWNEYWWPEERVRGLCRQTGEVKKAELKSQRIEKKKWRSNFQDVERQG